MPLDPFPPSGDAMLVAGSPHVTQFYIATNSSLQERRPRTLKHGDTFGLFDHNGDAIGSAGSPEGLYHLDTRHLSFLQLSIDGARPMLLSSTLSDDNSALTCDLTNPDLSDHDGNLRMERDLIHIRRTRFLWNGTCYERLVVHSFDESPRRLRIDISFAADFADLFEVRGATRARRGTLEDTIVSSDAVALSYMVAHQCRYRWRAHEADILQTPWYSQATVNDPSASRKDITIHIAAFRVYTRIFLGDTAHHLPTGGTSAPHL